MILIVVLCIIVLAVTLCLSRRNQRWFLIEPSNFNPYKLIYRVTKFARHRAQPVHLSNFIDSEDENPTRLDLAKEKYGGSFTTEQVEDVKAFYGIFTVLIAFGAVFFLDFAADGMLPIYAALHTGPIRSCYGHNCSGSMVPQHLTFLDISPRYMFLNAGRLSPLLIVLFIPLYLCLLRPFMPRSFPNLGVLRRMGLGIIFILLSLVATFSMDVAADHAHGNHNTTMCMFTYDYDFLPMSVIYNVLYEELPPSTATQSSLLLMIQLTMLALGHILIYTAVFEFIFTHSPKFMEGLLVGLLYAIKGFYQLLAAVSVVPFVAGTLDSVPPSCGFYYYLTNVILGVVFLVMFAFVSTRYNYRNKNMSTSPLLSNSMERNTLQSQEQLIQ